MNCPNCNDLFITYELNEVEIDHCTNCGSIWLDSEELELLLEGASEKDKLLNSFQDVFNSPEKIIRCPICDQKMKKVSCGDKQPVILDQCSQGHGLWFHERELQHVLAEGKFDADQKVPDLLKELFQVILASI